MKKIYTILFLIFCVNQLSFSQSEISISAPNSASLGKFVEMPVSPFTGIPDINIPLYQIKEGNFTLPISLSYHATGFNPNEVPGSVGQGWALNAGGVITRKVKGQPDDVLINFTDYDRSSKKFTTSGYLNYDYSRIKHSQDPIKDLYMYKHNPESGKIFDGEPDEFIFNFSGYSGKFIFKNGSTPVVYGGKGLKIEIHPYLFKETNSHPYSSDGRGVSHMNIYSIRGFTITTPDGYKYEFGSYSTDREDVYQNMAIERSCPMDEVFINNPFYTTTAWYLVRVTSPTGKQVAKLTYKCGYGKIFTEGSSLCLTRSILYSNAGEIKTAEVRLSGSVTNNCYLDKIYMQNSIIEFVYSEADQLYPFWGDLLINNRYLEEDSSREASKIRDILGLYYDPISHEPMSSKIISKQLDRIIVKDISNERNIYNSVNFEYTENNKERLRLLKIQKDGEGPYLFDYNNLTNRYILKEESDREIEGSYPIEYGNILVDQWGYYTGHLPNAIGVVIDNSRGHYEIRDKDRTKYYFRIKDFERIDYAAFDGCEDFDSNGNLNFCINKIIYPTGGYTTFEYEPHKYTMAFDREESGMPYLNKKEFETETGGVRIKSIKYFDNISSNPTLSKEYVYEMGILTRTNKNLYRSHCLFEYSVPGARGDFPIFGGCKTLDANFNNYIAFYDSNSLVPMSSNGTGQHIGYSKVTEIQKGIGKTEYYYRNFEDHPSLYSQAELTQKVHHHLDDFNGDIVSSSCYSPQIHMPLTNFDMERGMIIAEKIYSEDNKLKSTQKYSYEKPTNFYDFSTYSAFQKTIDIAVPVQDFQNGVCTSATLNMSFIFQYDYNIYYYPFMLSRKETVEYIGDKSIATEVNYTYTYDSYRNIVYPTTETKKVEGKEIEKIYYNIDYILKNNYSAQVTGDKSILKKMEDLNMSLTVLEERMYEIFPNKEKLLLSGNFIKYKDFGNSNYQPFEIFNLNLEKPSSDLTETKFNANGNFILLPGYSKEVEFNNYDDNGNLLKSKAIDGVSKSYFWAYNNFNPIVVAENMDNNVLTLVISSALKKLNKQDIDELILELDDMSTIEQRNLWQSFVQEVLSDSQSLNSNIAFYTYKPLAGITSMTDSSGLTTYYTYDKAGRLTESYLMEDGTKKVLQFYDYNYQNQ